jgi:hypothetical protein
MIALFHSKMLNMKNKIILFAIYATILAGCSADLLEKQPNDRYTEDTYWTSEKTAMAALSGCYNILRADGTFGGDATPLWEETATPNAYNYDNSMGYNVIALGTHTAMNSSIINNRYPDCYRGIGRCNTLLARIDAVPMNESLKERAKAEAKFLRALYYHLLQSYYGDVPLITEEPDLEKHGRLPRTDRALVVQQILTDLEDAAAVLPEKYPAADRGRATKGAALALKARVLLFEASPLVNPDNNVAKWEAAAAAAKAVIDMAGSAGYGLFEDYRALFLPANENSKECIFDVQFKAPEQGSSFDLINRQYNTNAPLKDLINAYEMKDGLPYTTSPMYDPAEPYKDRDPRMYQTIVYPGDTYMGAVTTPTAPFKITGYGVKKYSIYDKEPNTKILNGGQSEINYMVIRYADVLLMYAEAQNEVAGPDASVYNAINAVRARAGMPDIPVGKTKDEMREIIRHERRIEFAMEGFYYTDIRRWKIAEQVMNGVIYDSQDQPIVTRSFDPARDYWWPIPQGERDLNPELTQNLNY